MKDTNRPIEYPKCRCVEGLESDWEHLNEKCIGIHPKLRKVVGIILSLLAISCYYEAITTVIYTEEESVFWGTIIAAFVFTVLAIDILRARTMREVTVHCKKCKFKAILNFKGK